LIIELVLELYKKHVKIQQNILFLIHWVIGVGLKLYYKIVKINGKITIIIMVLIQGQSSMRIYYYRGLLIRLKL
jgi:hypothetical protein